MRRRFAAAGSWCARADATSPSPTWDDTAPRHGPELRERRDAASERLSAAVMALENIRLGLLRLQIGSAPVAQVTEALEAAARIGREIDLALHAEREIGVVLRPKRSPNLDPEPSPV